MYLYIITAIIIILFILLMIQLYKKEVKLDKKSDLYYNIYVNTTKGLIQTSNNSVVNELNKIKSSLIANSSLATSECKDLISKINISIKNIHEFIKENPTENEDALCKLDIKLDLINQYLTESITPNTHEYATAYKSLLEYEEYERDIPHSPKEYLDHLIKNLDLTIVLLNNDVCRQGRLDLVALYNVIMALTKEYCITGKLNYDQVNTMPNKSDFEIKKLNMFLDDINTMEPFESSEINIRKKPPKGSFGKLSDDFATQLSDNNEDNYNQALMQKFDSDIRKNTYTNNTHNKYVNNVNSIDNSYKGVYKGNRNLFEDTQQYSMLGYEPPGNIVNKLYDRSDHYTLNVNSCNGITPTDDELIRECVNEDMKYKKALDGDASQMLDCIGSCDNNANYSRFYDQLVNTSAGSDSYL